MPEALSLTLDMILVLAVVAATVVLFVSEVVRIDVAALCILVTLGLMPILPGIDPLLSQQELLSGFSSNAVMAIIATMILGAGLDKTGIMNHLAQQILKRGQKSESKLTFLVGLSVSFVSSFMQNVGTAALFMPVVSRISARTGVAMSRLLIPMGFCTILGGTITMIGSSPLIVLNDLLLGSNLPDGTRLEPLGLFAVAPVGLALSAVGIAYFVLAGRYVLPEHREQDSGRFNRASDYFESVYGIKGELFEARVSDSSPMVGQTIRHVEDNYPSMPPILALYSGDVIKVPPDREETIWVNTSLGLLGEREQIQAFCDEHGWDLKGEPELFSDVLNAQHSGIAEVVIPPGSSLIGQLIKDIKPRRNYGANILQIFRSEQIIRHGFADTELRVGDTLVVHSSWRDLAKLSRSRDFVVAADVRYEDTRAEKMRRAVAFFVLSLVLFFVTDDLSLSLLAGALGMVLSGVLSMDEAYNAVSWPTVFLLACLIPLGLAVDKSGAAAWITQEVLTVLGDMPAWVLQTVIALLATFFTLVMSNIGATVLLVPLAISVANAVGADPTMFALTVALATSNSFLIPTHQVNALLMGPGNYQVADFMRAGGIMTVLFLIVSLLMLNLIF